MARPLPSLDEKTDASEAYRLLLSGAPAIFVTREKLGVGLINRADLIATWVHRDGYAPEQGKEGSHAL